MKNSLEEFQFSSFLLIYF